MDADMQLDELDRKIIAELQEDGRKSFRKIAEAIDSTPVTVINRVEKLQDAGIISGFSVDLDYRALGHDLVVIIELVAKGGDMSELEEIIQADPHIQAMYEITGETDLILLGKFKNREEISDFVLQELSNSNMVEKTITHVTTGHYWERDRLPI